VLLHVLHAPRDMRLLPTTAMGTEILFGNSIRVQNHPKLIVKVLFYVIRNVLKDYAISPL